MNTLPPKPDYSALTGREIRRARRRREKAKQALNQPEAGSSRTQSDDRDTPLQNGSSSNDVNHGETSTATGKATFSAGDDFIPFVFSDGSSDEIDGYLNTGGSKDKDRGRERAPDSSFRVHGGDETKGGVRDDTPPMAERAKGKSNGRDLTPPTREWDKGKARERSRDRDRRRDNPRERDSDRSGGKRKYDMVFDFDDGFANKKQRTDALSRKAPWVTGLDWGRCNNVAEMLHCEVEAFTKWISPSPVEDEVRGLIVSLIAKAVTTAFPDAQVFPFGSFETKLYLPLGDIDLVVLSNSMAYSDKVTVLHALANTIKRAGITSKVTIIAKAKVPIVKFITMHCRFNVDISINQSNGVVSGKIINGFLSDLHGGGMALRSLVMITKAFLSQRSMNEVFTGGLGSYSIVCLAVSFLQMHPKIRQSEIDAEKNLGVLVMEFFELYGCYFNYEEVGISVREGGTYFSKRQRGWHDYYKGNLLSIEDPADPSNDISKGSYGFPKVRQTLAGAHGILTSTAYLRAGMISSRREGRSVKLRGQYQSEDLSILSSIMGITQETINHRKLVNEVYDKRTLHKLVGVNPKSFPEIVNSSNKPNTNARPSSSSNSRGAQSVQSAWEEADMVLNSDDEQTRANLRNKRERNAETDEEEGGRYDIGRRQPPRKRQKTGKQHGAHAVFTTDEEEEGELISTFVHSVDEEEEEAYAYASDEGREFRGELHSKAASADAKVDKRRSYWLSKGIGIGGDDSS